MAAGGDKQLTQTMQILACENHKPPWPQNDVICRA